MSARLAAAGCVFAEEEAQALYEAAGSESELHAMVARRVAGEPLEYILGWALFDGLRIPVHAGVFIPRRRTEALLRQALVMLGPHGRVLELCCGAAPVAAALSARRPDLVVCATDVDPAAVECARRSLPEVYCGDLFASLPRQRFDLIVANAPYVPTRALQTLPRESRSEAMSALDGGVDGLDLHRRIAAEARDWLSDGGSVLCEVAPAQADSLSRVYRGYDVQVNTDEQYDVAVVICSRRKAK